MAEEADRQRDEGITNKHPLGQLRKNPEYVVDKPGCLFCAEKFGVRKYTAEEQVGWGELSKDRIRFSAKKKVKRDPETRELEKSDPRENSRKGGISYRKLS